MDFELEIFVARLKRLSNLDYCESAGDMQDALEKINDYLNQQFPSIMEE
jgi:hypothetical protein